jgi:hypothetical protein
VAGHGRGYTKAEPPLNNAMTGMLHIPNFYGVRSRRSVDLSHCPCLP